MVPLALKPFVDAAEFGRIASLRLKKVARWLQQLGLVLLLTIHLLGTGLCFSECQSASIEELKCQH